MKTKKHGVRRVLAFCLCAALLAGMFAMCIPAQAAEGDEITVYFADVLCYGTPRVTVYYSNESGKDPIFTEMTLAGQNAEGQNIYKYTFDSEEIESFRFEYSNDYFCNVTELAGDTVYYLDEYMEKIDYRTKYSCGSYAYDEAAVTPVQDITVYFTDNKEWGEAWIFLITDTSDGDGTLHQMTLEGQDADGYNVYSYTFNPVGVLSLVFYNTNAYEIEPTAYASPNDFFVDNTGHYCADGYEYRDDETGDLIFGEYFLGTYTFTSLDVSTTGESAFQSINISLGTDIKVNYYVNAEGLTEPEMRFTINGYTKTVAGVPDGGLYKFVFDGVAPQWIGDDITAELLDGGEPVEDKHYTVLAYLQKLQADYASDTAMQKLIADLLVYGGAAQEYTGHNTGSLVSAGVEGREFAPLDETDKTVSQGEVVTFESATVFFDSTNTLRFYFTSTDLTDVVFKLKVGEDDEEEIAYTENGGQYRIETDAVYACGFDDVYTLTAYVNGVEDASLTYSVKSYVYAKQGGETAMAALARATYNYGLAAQEYIATR